MELSAIRRCSRIRTKSQGPSLMPLRSTGANQERFAWCKKQLKGEGGALVRRMKGELKSVFLLLCMGVVLVECLSF